jgi:hypothetical protein
MKKLTRDEMKNVVGGKLEGGMCKYVNWPCNTPQVAGDPYCKCFLGLAW